MREEYERESRNAWCKQFARLAAVTDWTGYITSVHQLSQSGELKVEVAFATNDKPEIGPKGDRSTTLYLSGRHADKFRTVNGLTRISFRGKLEQSEFSSCSGAWPMLLFEQIDIHSARLG
jgi:hypothetical protein